MERAGSGLPFNRLEQGAQDAANQSTRAQVQAAFGGRSQTRGTALELRYDITLACR